MRINPAALALVFGFLSACDAKEAEEERIEGMEAGDCSDRADNDGDGLFDCDDDGCAGSPDCTDDTGDGGSGSSGSGSGDSGSGGSGSGGSGSSGSGSGGSGSSGSGSGSGGDGAENRPPIADAGADVLACPNQDVTLNGTGSYDPDGTIVSYDWDPTSSGGATPTIRAASSEGSTLRYELVVTDDEGAESSPDQTIITTNTSPDYRSASAVGDCSYLRDLDTDWPWFVWDDVCDDYACSCTLTFTIEDPDGNEMLDWEYLPDDGGTPVVSGNSITVSTTGRGCYNDGGTLQYTDPCGEPLGDSDTPDVRYSTTCP